MTEPRRWARCGGSHGATQQRDRGSTSAASSDIEALRAGLHRAENPHGVLRGSLRPEPPDRVAALLAACGTASAFAVFGSNTATHQRGHASASASSASSSSSNAQGAERSNAAPVLIMGTQMSMSVASHVRSAPPPRPQPLGNEKALELRRKHKVVRSMGGSTGGVELPDPEWVCAICLSNRWERVQLSRMPRCDHCFHSSCVDKWFLRSGKCPSCRQPV